MSLGFSVVMLLCAGIAFSWWVIDPAIIHLPVAAACPVAGVGNCYLCPAADENVRPKPVGFWVSFRPAVCERQNIL